MRANDPTQTQATIEALESQLLLGGNKGAAAPPTPPTVFVYRPGAAHVSGSNVYGSVGGQQDPALDVAISKASGDVLLQVDDSLVSPAVLGAPSTPWRTGSIQDITIEGVNTQNINTGLPFSAITQTALIYGISRWRQISGYTYSGATTAVAPAAGLFSTYWWDDVQLVASTHPFFDATAAGAGLLVFFDNSVVLDGVPFGVTNAGTLAFDVVLNGVKIGSNALSGPANKYTFTITPNGFLGYTQSGLTGGLGALVTNKYTIVDSVTTRKLGNASRIVSYPSPDFTASDGLAHIVATIPIDQFATNTGNRFDILVQAVLAAGGYMSASYRVKCQVVGGVVTTTPVTTVDSDDVTGTGWTFVVAVSGANVTVTTTTANGAVTSTTVQQTAAVV